MGPAASRKFSGRGSISSVHLLSETYLALKAQLLWVDKIAVDVFLSAVANVSRERRGV